MPETVATLSADVRAGGAPGLYDTDFYTWTVQQAAALQRRDAEAIDWDNVIEEIESLGKQQKRTWTSHAAQAIHHLLKIEHYEHAADRDLIHWSGEVKAQRAQMAEVIEESPGLKGQLGTLLEKAWKNGRCLAIHSLASYDHERPETRASWDALSKGRERQLPEVCNYRLEDVTAFDPKRHKEPDLDTWPPQVALVLNAVLGSRYRVRRRPDRGPAWSR